MGVRTWLRNHGFGFGPAKYQRPRAAFEAAQSGRLTADFFRPQTSADASLIGELAALRNGARALARDNCHAREIKRTYKVNVIGHRGIQLQPQIRTASGEDFDERRNRMVLEEWQKWCRADSCDVAGRHNFHGFELQIPGALCESGEVFFRLVRRPFGRSRVPLALEMIEADWLDEHCTGPSDRPGHLWRMGVEVDTWGRPSRYKFLANHPGDYELSTRASTERHVIVDASEIIHCYGLPERVGQTRFEPILTPAIVQAHALQQYQKAHLVRKRVQSSQLGWIQTPEGLTGDDVVDNRRVVDSAAGQWYRLNPGEVPVAPNLGPEDTSYADVVKDMLRTQAVGVGVNYSTLSGDFSAGSYASLRISVFENRDFWRMLHSAIIDQFHQRVYEEWLRAAALVGALPSPTFDSYWSNPDRYTRPHWQPRSWGLLDTAKDISAFEKARELQLETHADQINNYTGESYRRTIDQIAAENEYKRQRGLLKPLDDPALPESPAADGGQQQIQ
jgi:lambda family phage portal protein